MGLLNTIFVSAFASLPLALGQASISIQRTCLTDLGHKSVSPILSSTSTTSDTTTLTAVSTTTPHVTIYPSTYTVTATIISSVTVTASQITDTFSSTSSVIVNNTLTNTVTSTVTSSFDITVTTVGTTTIPTSAGFQFPGTSIVAKRRAVRHEHRERFNPMGSESGNDSPAKATRQKVIPPGQHATKNAPERYPTSVVCQETINTYTTTTIVISAAAMTETAPTPITTSTHIITFTSTFLPTDASTTLTFTNTVQTTDTVLVPFTETLSVTDVITVTQPGPTVYAACAAANLIDSGEGHSINMITYIAAASESIATATTPYDCCVACQNRALCGGTDFALGVCELIIASTCDATVSVAGYKADASSSAPAPGSSNRFYISNGICGNVVYQGLDAVGL